MEGPDFPVIDVSSWRVTDVEPEGLDAMDWVEDPASGSTWLFKPVTAKNGRLQGEDWAEKVVAEVSGELGLPCAEVDLARRDEQRGSISRNLRPDGWQLQSGAVLLASRMAPRYTTSKAPGRPGHSPENIRDLLAGFGPPRTTTLPDSMSAFGVFVGYLVLDALVANRDRHDQNWAVLLPNGPGQSQARLCGSYDHAGSLGYNLTDERRTLVLEQADGMRRWAEAGTAWRFEHDPAAGKRAIPTLVALASSALRLLSEAESDHWLAALERWDPRSGERVLSRVPGLSEVARTFATKVLEENRRRLLDECR